MIRVVVCNDYAEMSAKAAAEAAELINKKPDAVLGLATGSTPEGMYAEWIRMNGEGKMDFSRVRTINLDEYYPISPENSQSYRYFMNDKLFNHVNIDLKNTNVPNGQASDPAAACREYEALYDKLGGVDLQVLGIGRNGHIGFNEPAEELIPDTHVTDLTADTIDANARFFASADEVPHQAMTMGMHTILKAKKIVILANGAGKAEAVQGLLRGTVSTKCPASFLQLHGDVTLFCDRAAMGFNK